MGINDSLNGGIFLREVRLNVSDRLDSYHLYTFLKQSEPMDLGPVDLWAFAKKAQHPLYTLASFNKNNIIEVDSPDGSYKYKVPIPDDLPYIVADIDPSNVNKGIAGTTFKIKLNRRAFGHGEIITYDKFNGLELYVTDEDIMPVSDGYIYTVRLVNNDSTAYLSNDYLKPGTKYFSKGSAKGEFTERYGDMEIGVRYREYYNYVGRAEAHTSFYVSSRADAIRKGMLTSDGALNAVEIWKVYNTKLDPSISSFKQLYDTVGGKEGIKKMVKEGNLVYSFLTKLEAIHMSKITSDIENYLMWGTGGRIKQDAGADDIRLSVGLWRQLDRGFKFIYNYDSFSLDIFKSEIFNYFSGRVDFKGPDPHRQILVHTGMGGFNLIQTAIRKELANGPFSTLHANQGNTAPLSGNRMSMVYGYAFTGIIFPFLANVTFVYNPIFDNYLTNEIENPMINGFPLSSYSFIIFDVTDNNQDNIYLLKWKYDNEFKWFYQNGDMDYLGRKAGFQSSGVFSGFKVFMSQTMPGIWVKDPTRIMKIVMRNPITGGTI